MFDCIIRQSDIADGSGEPLFRGDIGVRDGLIAEIAPRIEGGCAYEINAAGMVAAPGFIDVHTHDDLVFDTDPMNMPKLAQGVTTVVTGNCGLSAAPCAEQNRQLLIDYSAPIFGPIVSGLTFPDFAAYTAHLAQLPKSQNIAVLVPHGSVRIAAMGFSAAPITAEQLETEKAYVREAMQAGALGMSLGLMYAPGCYAQERELFALADIVADYGGIVTIHMKSESENFETSIAEAAKLSKTCRVPVQISHLKHVGKQYWGHMDKTLALIETEIGNGADLSFDMYPYTMGSTTMSILFPTKYLKNGVQQLIRDFERQDVRDDITFLLGQDWGAEDNLGKLCGWENVIISSVETQANAGCIGKSIRDIARERGVSEQTAVMDLFAEEGGAVAVLLNHILEEDMQKTILFPHVIPASDGLPGAKTPHPRLYGAFPRFLAQFVREKRLLSLEKAIHKITSMPARRFGLQGRGLLSPGYRADIVVFDPGSIVDTATYTSPREYPVGIKQVIVNGKVVMEHGVTKDTTPGELIKHTQK